MRGINLEERTITDFTLAALAMLLGLAATTLACGVGAPSSMPDAPVAQEGGTTAPVPTPFADDPMRSARSAAPSSISANATIMDWNLNVVSQGTNGWTCLPNRADTPGNAPWCVTEPWFDFLEAHRNQTEPTYTELGLAYMLQGGAPVSSADPFATEETGPEDWVTDPRSPFDDGGGESRGAQGHVDGSPERRPVGHVAGQNRGPSGQRTRASTTEIGPCL